MSTVALGAMGLLTMTQANPAQAVTLLQTQTFTQADTFTNFPTASAIQATYNSILPQFTVQPFNAGLGTLTSTGIVWETIASFTGTSGTADASGSASFSLSGGYYVNNISYSGNGGGNGNGAPSGNTFSVNVSPITKDTQFLTSQAGVTYDPAILTSFLGGFPYTITYGNGGSPFTSPYTFNYTNIVSGSASFATTATVTYNYTAVPTPPVPLLGIGAALTWSRRLRRRCAQRQG
jgi:ABC-type sugar transport system permease subunit